jgi:membrane protein implicated in regulation of membrane protease activity
MALRLVSLLVSLVLLGVLGTSLSSRLHSTPKSSPASAENLLRTTGLVVERTHQITGQYAGVGVQDNSSIRLVSADANGYCLQLTWVDRQVYHLRGPGGQPAAGAC